MRTSGNHSVPALQLGDVAGHYGKAERRSPWHKKSRSKDAGGATASRYRDPFAEMRAEMDRVFDSFLGRSFFGRPALFGKAAAAATIAPDIDIRENDKEIVIEAELPGIEEKNVEVVVRNGLLSLNAASIEDGGSEILASPNRREPIP